MLHMGCTYCMFRLLLSRSLHLSSPAVSQYGRHVHSPRALTPRALIRRGCRQPGSHQEATMKSHAVQFPPRYCDCWPSSGLQRSASRTLSHNFLCSGRISDSQSRSMAEEHGRGGGTQCRETIEIHKHNPYFLVLLIITQSSHLFIVFLLLIYSCLISN